MNNLLRNYSSLSCRGRPRDSQPTPGESRSAGHLDEVPVRVANVAADLTAWSTGGVGNSAPPAVQSA
jgi:hypothetical protein